MVLHGLKINGTVGWKDQLERQSLAGLLVAANPSEGKAKTADVSHEHPSEQAGRPPLPGCHDDFREPGHGKANEDKRDSNPSFCELESQHRL